MFYLSELPFGFLVTVYFILGVIIGSFLNVYLYRLHTGKSLMGSSHCLSCGHRLRAFELVPLFSYLALRGRCRKCNSHIPKRYILVELLTGVLFVAAAAVTADMFTLLHLLFFVSVLIVIAVYDIYHLVIPDELVGTLVVTAMMYKFYLLIIGYPIQVFWFDIAAALTASLFLVSLWRFSKGRWIGFGDVKLVIPLSLWVGYASVFSMVVLSFWIGAIVGVLTIVGYKLYRRGQPHLRFVKEELTMKSAIPFAPFLILGYLTVLIFGIDVISLLSYVP